MRYFVYTDGGCRGNPGPGAYAVAVWDEEDNLIYSESARYQLTTNNRMEIKAIQKSIKFVVDRCTIFDEIIIHSDSQLCIGILSQGWKSTKNLDLWEEIKNLNYDSFNITFKKVKGHSGDEKNDFVDEVLNENMDEGEETETYLIDKNYIKEN